MTPWRGRLTGDLKECIFLKGAFAVQIIDAGSAATFQGWMIACIPNLAHRLPKIQAFMGASQEGMAGRTVCRQRREDGRLSAF